MIKKYLFKLYLIERTSKSEQIIRNLKKSMKDELKDQFSLEVIYITENPELAKRAKVICTPTLIKEQPLPVRRIVGDLIDKEKVLTALDLAV